MQCIISHHSPPCCAACPVDATTSQQPRLNKYQRYVCYIRKRHQCRFSINLRKIHFIWLRKRSKALNTANVSHPHLAPQFAQTSRLAHHHFCRQNPALLGLQSNIACFSTTALLEDGIWIERAAKPNPATLPLPF